MSRSSSCGRLVLVAPPDELASWPGTCRERRRNVRRGWSAGPHTIFSSFDQRSKEQLGLGCLAAALRQAGHEVKVIHCDAEELTEAKAAEQIVRWRPDWIGIGVLYARQSRGALEIAEQVRRSGLQTHITLGGSTASGDHSRFLTTSDAVSSVVVGEGEITAVELVETLGRGGCWRRVAGVASAAGDQVSFTARMPSPSLQTIPIPDRDVLDLYRQHGIEVPVVSLFSSRGCLANCVFCNGAKLYSGPFRQSYRYRTGAEMADELSMLVDRYGVRRFYYVDDNFLGYRGMGQERLPEFAEEVLHRGLEVELAAECRADAINRRLLQLLKQAGLRRVLLGLESGSQDALDRWRKGLLIEQNERALRLCRELELEVEPSMILVDQATTATELRDSIAFLRTHELHRCRNPLFLINRQEVYPGSTAARQLDQEHLLDRPQVPGSNLAYRCLDPRIDAVWQALEPICHDLYRRSEDELPIKASAVWQAAREARRRGDTSKSSSATATLRALRAWRAHLGELVLELLETCLGSLDRTGPLAERLRAAVAAYDQRWLGSIAGLLPEGESQWSSPPPQERGGEPE